MTFKDLPKGAYFTFKDCMPSENNPRMQVFRKVVVSPTILLEQTEEIIGQILNEHDATVSSVDQDALVYQVYL